MKCTYTIMKIIINKKFLFLVCVQALLVNSRNQRPPRSRAAPLNSSGLPLTTTARLSYTPTRYAILRMWGVYYWPHPLHHPPQVEMLQEGFEEWQPIIQQPRVYFMVKNLLPNTSYHFRVTAINDYGASPPSEGTKVVMGVKGRWQSFRRGHVPAITINTSIGENYHCVIIIIIILDCS